MTESGHKATSPLDCAEDSTCRWRSRPEHHKRTYLRVQNQIEARLTYENRSGHGAWGKGIAASDAADRLEDRRAFTPRGCVESEGQKPQCGGLSC